MLHCICLHCTNKECKHSTCETMEAKFEQCFEGWDECPVMYCVNYKEEESVEQP